MIRPLNSGAVEAAHGCAEMEPRLAAGPLGREGAWGEPSDLLPDYSRRSRAAATAKKLEETGATPPTTVVGGFSARSCYRSDERGRGHARYLYRPTPRAQAR